MLGGDSFEFIYWLRPGLEPVTPRTGEETVEIIRERLRRLGISNVYVTSSASGRIRLTLSGHLTNRIQGLIDEVRSPAQLYFYDWEPNLIGPERSLGAHPGQRAPRGAIERAEAEWKAAGRSTTSSEDRQLMFSGALPSAYAAVLLASELAPQPDCASCSIAKTRYYLFQSTAPHSLIGGPEFSESDLYITPTARKQVASGMVLAVPPGIVVVSEEPLSRVVP